MNLDDRLRQALRRRQPPEEFEQRVLAAVRNEARKDRRRREAFWERWFPLRTWAAAMAALAVLFLTVGQVREHWQQRQAGLQAREKLIYALELTSAKLTYAQQKALQERVIARNILEKP